MKEPVWDEEACLGLFGIKRPFRDKEPAWARKQVLI